MTKLRKELFNKALLLLTCAAAPLLANHSPAYAAPEGGTVTQGSANISQTDKLTTIHQTSDRALIDWRGFDLAPDEAARFVQPSASSLTINRVNNPNPTVIQGKLSANGNIVLLNPNGVMFSKTSQVDVNGLVASTSSIRDEDFAAGKLDFKPGANPIAAVTNEGNITARDAGLVGLVAPNVLNSGVINAKLGKVQLASGDTYTLDLAGNGIINIEVSDAVKQQVVANVGEIDAAGGTIQLSAAAGREVVNSLVLASGSLSATSVGQKNGKIIISAEGSNAVKGNDASKKGKKSGESVVLLDGVVNASGRKTGEKGGSVEVTGDYVVVNDGAFIDASGDVGGGDIKIGGDYLGTGTTETAKMTSVASGAIIANDAVTSGNGGRTIVWSDGTTEFYGNIFGRGGALGGDGGFVETSGKEYLDAQGFVDLTAPNGNKGQYLLDPTNIAIYGAVDPRFVSTDGTSINLLNGLSLWLDSADRTKVKLTYTSDFGVAYTGTSGTNTITSVSNVDNTALLQVGARIRLGAGGTVLASDALDANTYTVASVAVVGGKTVITTVEALSATYTAQSVYRGLVSEWTDKSNFANNATQTGNAMPLWVGNRANNKDVLYFDGINDFMTIADHSSLDGNTNGLSVVIAHTPLANNTVGGLLSKRNNAGTSESYSFFYYTGQALTLDLPSSSGNRLTTAATYPAGTANIFAIVYNGTLPAAQRIQVYNRDSLTTTSGSSAAANLTNTNNPVNIGYLTGNAGSYQQSYFKDVTLYSRALGTNERILLEQYMAAKWGNVLGASGTTLAQEVAAATHATTGYSVFTTDYLERLSQTADVTLKATKSAGTGGNITLDLKNDSLDFTTANRSLTLDAEGNILTASAGTINTNGGGITFKATDGILLNHRVDLNSNGGNIVMSNNVTLGANQAWNAGTGAITTSGTVNGGYNLTTTSGVLNQNGTWGGVTPLSNAVLNLTTLNAAAAGITAVNNLRIDGNVVATANQLWKSTAGPVRVIGTVDGFYNFTVEAAGLFAKGGGWGLTTPVGAVSITANSLNLNNGRFNTNNSNLSLNGPIALTTSQNWATGTGVINVNGAVTADAASAYNLTATGGGIAMNGAWGAGNALNTVTLTSASNLTLDSINATTIRATTTGAHDITVAAGKTLQASAVGDAIRLVSGRNFYNLSSNASLLTPNGNWLVYSTNPANDTIGGLSNAYRRFSCTFGGTCPTLGTGNGLLYSYTPTISIAPTAVNLTYGDSVTTNGYAYAASGYLGSDASADTLTGTLVGTTDYTVGSDVGTYYINHSSGTLTSAMGYGISGYGNNATAITVSKKDITVAFDGALSKVYGSANPTLDYSNFTFTGLIDNSHNALFTSITPDWNGVTTTSNVNSYTIGATVADTANYNIVTNTVSGTLDVLKKDITVAFDGALSKVYGSANPTLDYSNFTFTGLIDNGHNALFTSITPDWNGVTATSNVNSYTIGATVADTANYNIVTNTVAGNLNITKKALTITANGATRYEGEANPAFTSTFNGLTAWDTQSTAVSGLTYATPATPASPAGNYYIRPQGATSVNYQISFVDGLLQVLVNGTTPPPPPPPPVDVSVLPDTVVASAQTPGRDTSSTSQGSALVLREPNMLGAGKRATEQGWLAVSSELDWLLNTPLEDLYD